MVKMDIFQTRGFKRNLKSCGQRNDVIVPKFVVPFDVHNDACGFQPIGVLFQEQKPVAIFPRKLTYTQKRFTAI